MNKLLRGAIAPLALALVISSCAKDSDDNNNKNGYKEFPELKVIVANYVDNTVIATYADMKTGCTELVAAVKLVKENRTDANIETACKAWQHTRKAWESSEAFLYGPAADEAIDPSLDSWPLDQNLLDQILKGKDAINQKALSNNVRGFHTLEYLLFKEGRARKASEINDREVEFLSEVTTGLYEDILNLHTLWSEGDEAFGTAVKALNSSQAIEQLIDGITVITDEVGNAKIKDPYESQNVLDVESWFSWNSLTDFVNNIKGAENAYLGGYDVDKRAHSLQSFVKAQNPELDKEIVEAFASTIKNIQAIGEPFRNNLKNNDAKIKAAMKSCGDLTDLFTVKVKALIVY